MTANIYEKLDEAHSLYLNPTYEMLHKGYDLAAYCYYKLKHYPTFSDPIWTMIETYNFDALNDYLIDEDDSDAKINNNDANTTAKKATKKPKKEDVARTHLIHNITKAVNDRDVEYLNYLMLNKPKRKITLTLKKNANTNVKPTYLIDLELAAKFGILNVSELNGLNLKKKMNKYIYDQRLQEGPIITMDEVLQQLFPVFIDNSTMNIFSLHREFKKKYLA